MKSTMSLHNGMPLLGAWSALLTLTCLALIMMNPGVDGWREIIRLTARTSAATFMLAFTAASAYRLWPNAWTRWQLRNRRHIGLAFVVSHGLHAVAILAFARLAPEDFAAQTGGMYGPQLLAYAFIVAMGVTSFDRTAAWLGPRLWSWLHITGSHYLWLSFLVAFGKRIPAAPGYTLAVAACLLAMAIRLSGRRKASAAQISTGET